MLLACDVRFPIKASITAVAEHSGTFMGTISNRKALTVCQANHLSRSWQYEHQEESLLLSPTLAVHYYSVQQTSLWWVLLL